MIHEFVQIAQSFEGVPWRHRGASRLGIDCLHLVIVAGKQAGLIPSSYLAPAYSRNTSSYELLESLKQSGYVNELESWRQAERGDLLVQKFHVKLPASHLLIVTKRTESQWWAVHAGLRQVVTQRLIHHERCVSAFRFKYD